MLLLILCAALAALLAIVLGYTLLLGIRQAHDDRRRPGHGHGARLAFWLSLVLAAAMLGVERLGVLPAADPSVLRAHTGCIVAYLVLATVMLFALPGTRHRYVHIALGSLLTPIVVIAAITGLIMFGQALAAS